MIHSADLIAGEIYNYAGRRARLDKIGQTSEDYLEVVISTGRSFENSITLAGNKWRPDRIFDLNETWAASKERKKLAREHLQQINNLSQRLFQASEQLGLNIGYIRRDGTACLSGDTTSFTALVEAVEHKARQGHSSAISDLI